MQAVILAAGLGSRLRPLTDTTPKPLIEINGQSLIERSIRNLEQNDIEEIVIILGYLGEKVIDHVNSLDIDARVQFIWNQNYETTGSMYSLSQAREVLTEDIILLEGDLLYDVDIIADLKSSAHDNAILVAPLSKSRDEVFISVEKDFAINFIGKDTSDAIEAELDIIGELIGISKLSKDYLPHLFSTAEKRFETTLMDHYEETISYSTDENKKVYGEKLDSALWIEIDKKEDLYRARYFVHPSIRAKSMKIDRTILLNPGPLTTTHSVKLAQVVPDICPRELEFGELMDSIQRDITEIAGGDEEYYTVLFGGSGTASVEATISSVIRPEEKILVIINGAYGDRMTKIADIHRIEFIELRYEYGAAPSLEEIEAKLQDDEGIAAICMIHHETTTGLLNPVGEVGQLAKKYSKLFIVDTISSYAGIPYTIKDYNIDFMMSTSNKCLQGMPGASFVVCKLESLERCANIESRTLYLDLYDQYQYFKRTKQTRYTPPVQVLYSLRQAIDEFKEEGIQGRHQRFVENWEALNRGMEELGFTRYKPEMPQSKLLTTYYYLDHEKFDFDEMHDRMFDKGFTIYPGKLSEEDTFRLSNFGALTRVDMLNFIDNLGETLVEMGIQAS